MYWIGVPEQFLVTGVRCGLESGCVGGKLLNCFESGGLSFSLFGVVCGCGPVECFGVSGMVCFGLVVAVRGTLIVLGIFCFLEPLLQMNTMGFRVVMEAADFGGFGLCLGFFLYLEGMVLC